MKDGGAVKRDREQLRIPTNPGTPGRSIRASPQQDKGDKKKARRAIAGVVAAIGLKGLAQSAHSHSVITIGKGDHAPSRRMRYQRLARQHKIVSYTQKSLEMVSRKQIRVHVVLGRDPIRLQQKLVMNLQRKKLAQQVIQTVNARATSH